MEQTQTKASGKQYPSKSLKISGEKKSKDPETNDLDFTHDTVGQLDESQIKTWK
jgi:hypothetical protein